MNAQSASLLRRAATDSRGLRLALSGIVQGVGMRPHIYRLARHCGLCGDVRNRAGTVIVRVWGEPDKLETFVHALSDAPPPGALIARIEQYDIDQEAPKDFHILPSADDIANGGAMPDRATCEDCQNDILDPHSRRHHYAFTNCTACGPRYSILDALPWDRANTAMRDFALCPSCDQEYRDPDNRRFHAEPNACPACGPQLTLSMPGDDGLDGDAAIARTADLLREGAVLAIQGLGCFHLACDATNADAVQRLRDLKNRPYKALAMMALDTRQIHNYAFLDAAEAGLLQSSAAPIVLLRRRPDCRLPELVAPNLNRLGFMLPNTPMHHLLLRALHTPIVLTSANSSGQPAITDAALIDRAYGERIDGVLYHNRPIRRRIDDSVAQIIGGHPQWLRRARGCAPAPLPLPPGFENAPRTLALGGHLKNAFCLLDRNGATLSPWIGDLDAASLREDHRKLRDAFLSLYNFSTDLLAHDRHPDYFTTFEAQSLATASGARAVAVWHHHAHAAACLGENGRPMNAPPIGCLICDGSGLGSDGTVWGGELLLADYRESRPLARLQPVPLPGGEQAVKQPWRNLWSQLAHTLDWDRVLNDFGELPPVRELTEQPLSTLQRMCDTGTNSPLSSSTGRLFDAVAAALGIDRNAYEGEAAMRLQALAESSNVSDGYPMGLATGNALLFLQTTELWRALLSDLAAGTTKADIARRFHSGLAQGLAAMAEQSFDANNDWREHSIALSGGVFQNALLLRETVEALQARGFQVLTHREVPPNDSGLAFGQALVAAARQNAKIKGGLNTCV